MVHRDYGVGRVEGLKHLDVDGATGEFLEIAYDNQQKLWLPVTQLGCLQPHQGGVALSTMGSRVWQKSYQRAQKRAYDTAARLLDINARRLLAGVSGHRPDEAMLAQFSDNFVYQETPDQQQAMEQVLADLCADTPMDRLIIADVGFGKTEVAMRACAAAVFSGKQAAVLAPTTLLAEQHYQVFSDRFAYFPTTVERLTRVVSAAHKRQLLTDLAAGKIDIIIGTHALLQRGIRYKRLGLVIVDEEHRFGVRDKEKLKDARAGVDILSLSATPIPRTLAMALNSIRDISIISTPPAARLPVKTMVLPFLRAVIVEACERELARGGQVFFVHNEIRTIEQMREQMSSWLPRARIGVAHGDMSPVQLEYEMLRFLRREVTILLCTIIVESGLDIGGANTIIVNRADKMGLSRLHQLRGRVGRAGQQAYAYFLLPEDGVAGEPAQQRLHALQQHAALGSGFLLSLRDLEIRGSGEVLGERQSGDIEAVGCTLYHSMIKAAVSRMRADGNAPIEDVEAIIKLPEAVYLPASYIASPTERMQYYRRLAACADAPGIADICAEWRDRFGVLPRSATLLRDSHLLRLLAQTASIERLVVGKDARVTLTLRDNPRCMHALMDRIQAGVCQPVSAQAVRLTINAEDDLCTQVAQVLNFVGALVAGVQC